MQNITPTQIGPGIAAVRRDGKTIGHVTRDDLIGSPSFGKWEARPVHDALTVGKSFPMFGTRREAVEYVAGNY